MTPSTRGDRTHLFIFAGGGTGGHLYPGLAIAEELTNLLGNQAEFLFVCSERPIDAKVLTEANAPFKAIRARPIGARPRALVRFLWTWGEAVRESRRIIREARQRVGPQGSVMLVAMGGFVAAPMVMAARRERQPVTMVNLDAVPGKANRWIAQHAAQVISTFAVERYAGWTVVPPIVRRGARTSLGKAECRRELGLDERKPTLMVTGGSQGAKTVNQTIAAVAASGALAGWQVLHQCGKADAGSGGSREELIEAYAKAGVPAVVEEFTTKMGQWWGAADLAVSRSGANSVAEAWANRVPCVFMPYPYHRDQHQRLNALPLEQAGAAMIAVDAIDPKANSSGAAAVIGGVVGDADRLAAMRSALQRLGPADGAARVAAILTRA